MVNKTMLGQVRNMCEWLDLFRSYHFCFMKMSIGWENWTLESFLPVEYTFLSFVKFRPTPLSSMVMRICCFISLQLILIPVDLFPCKGKIPCFTAFSTKVWIRNFGTFISGRCSLSINQYSNSLFSLSFSNSK